MDAPHHDPVMLAEVRDTLALEPGMTLVDGTLGLAGHSLEFVKQIAPGGLLIGLDWDKDMLSIARDRLSSVSAVAIELYCTDYREMPEKVQEATQKHRRDPGAHAIFLDLGLNSAQIDDPERGIAFRTDGPLDFRMNRDSGETAAAFLNRASIAEIDKVLKVYGDERWSKRIAQVIVDRRKQKRLKTTKDLVDCVLAAVPPAMRDKRLHPATRTFQSIRVHINRELEGLEDAIERIAHCLLPGGVMAVLAYHSGEDRAVKHVFRELVKGSYEEIYHKPLTPSDEEVARNPRSRSAKLRAIRALPKVKPT